jgi:hypothetical protein
VKWKLTITPRLASLVNSVPEFPLFVKINASKVLRFLTQLLCLIPIWMKSS